MKKRSSNTGRIVNKRARFDYELGDSLLVGVILTGRETKALRQGHGQLRGAYVVIKDDELWLLNSTISSGKTFVIEEDEQTRSRKLLAKKREIAAFISAKQQGRTIVPLEFLTQGRHIKLKISIGKGRKHYDKREAIKKRDTERDIARRQV